MILILSTVYYQSPKTNLPCLVAIAEILAQFPLDFDENSRDKVLRFSTKDTC